MPALDHLAGLFHADMARLGTFEEVLVEQTPEPYRGLLAHHEHMTVAVERFHDSRVDVRVLATQIDGDFYSRQILLHRQSDRGVVLLGIPRLNLKLLSESVREEILSQQTPLGRVLIDHNVMREVQLASIYKIVAGPELCRLFDLAQPALTYGRTAFIYLDGYLAIELLEIVPPAADR